MILPLHVVAQDASKPVTLDLNAVVGEMAATWRDLAREKAGQAAQGDAP